MSVNSLVAADSITCLLPRILKSSGVVSCTLLELPLPPPVEERPGVSPALAALARQARTRQQEGESFTESFLQLGEHAGLVEEALQVARFHQPLSAASTAHALTTAEVSADMLNGLVRQTPPNHILVMTSPVADASGRTRHLPMLDFKLPATEANEPLATAVARRLGPGHLLKSGTSYHYYGDHPMEAEQLRDWLLDAQLFGRCVDGRWITHQLKERQCALRISSRGNRGMPTLVCRV